MTYAKLENGLITYSSQQKEGYKELHISAAPSMYHIESYTDAGDYIERIWVAPNLGTLKAIKKGEAEVVRDNALQATATVTVEDVGDVVYNQQAQTNILGMLVLAQASTEENFTTPYILADDSVIEADLITLSKIGTAIADHVANIYTTKTATFAAIEACETVEALLEL